MTPTSEASRGTLVGTTFYTLLLLVMGLIVFGQLGTVLPSNVARRIAFNSEGYVLALVLAPWIQFVRPRLHGTRHEWTVTLAAAAACLALAVLLFNTDFPSRFKTLNETFFAAAALIPLVQPRSPWGSRVGGGVSLAVLAVMFLGPGSSLVTLLAESLGMLLLVPIGLLVVDRAILDPGAPTFRRLRYTWYALLVATPILLSVLQYGIGVDGVADTVTRYGVRFHEAFVGLLLVELYLAVGQGRRGPRGTSPRDRVQPPVRL